MDNDIVTMSLDRFEEMKDRINELEMQIIRYEQTRIEELRKTFLLVGVDTYSGVSLVVNYGDIVRELYGDRFISPDGRVYELKPCKDKNKPLTTKEWDVYIEKEENKE